MDTWPDDAGRTAARRTAARAARPAPPPPIRRRELQGRPDPAEVAHELEMTLLRFGARRRALAGELRPMRGAWPIAMREAWQDVIGQVETRFAAARGALPRRILVQARVTLEAELELTERRFGPAPEAIETRVKGVFITVAKLMRATPRPARAGPQIDFGPVRFVWPVSPVVLTSPFGFRRDPILGESRVRFHAGIDLGGRRGDVVVAAAPGKVIGAGWDGGHGRTVTVRHPGGFVTRYSHLARILVPSGSEVDAGSPVGLMGSSGRSTGPHLHFEVRRGPIPLDPLEVLGRSAGYAAR